MATVNEDVLDRGLEALEKDRTWSPRLVSKLENFIRTADDWALFRINPYYFAEERGVTPDEAVDLFLYATRDGLFQMTWNLLCPGCGQAVQSFASLKNLSSFFHCYMCSTDIETTLDDFVQVGFTISPKVRSIPAHHPEALPIADYFQRYVHTREARLGPGGPRFVDMMTEMTFGQGYIEPGATGVFEFDAPAGALAVYDAVSTHVFTIMFEPNGEIPAGTLHLKISEGTIEKPPFSIQPGKMRLELENDKGQRAAAILLFKPQYVLDEMQRRLAAGETVMQTFDRFLCGRRLLNSQTFRRIFGEETIRSTEGIGVRDISILFTDLKGSTELYDRIGDLKAFALVNQHFDLLARAIIQHGGAVVKTIGDAVMASFEHPVEAVRAAHDMLRSIESFNNEVGEREIVLKVGVHRGASIAVTLNDRLDFFGGTVNIASRVQGLADADEIFITHEVYTAPGVKDVLRELHVTPQQRSLKGVQREVSVYRVATSAPAA